MKFRNIYLALQVGLIGSVVYGQGEPFLPIKKRYNPSSIPSTKSPAIDGILNDPIWLMGEWQGQFVQREPEENQAPTGQTKFKIQYDVNNLYIGIPNQQRSTAESLPVMAWKGIGYNYSSTATTTSALPFPSPLLPPGIKEIER